jgi:type IV secretory pathway VirJ component
MSSAWADAALRASGRAAFASVWLAVLASFAPHAVTAAPGEDPLVLVPPPAGTDGPLVLLMSGDGDWAAFVRELAQSIVARGAPVLGLKSRTWFSEPRTPEQSAVLLETALRAQLAAWNRKDVVIVGYSRGADLAPFVVNRWSEELRARVRKIVLIGLSEGASFEFHLEDLVRDVARPTDSPTRPEIEHLTGIPLVCVRGTEEEDSFCARPVAGMRVVAHEGGHRATASSGTGTIVMKELGLEP